MLQFYQGQLGLLSPMRKKKFILRKKDRSIYIPKFSLSEQSHSPQNEEYERSQLKRNHKDSSLNSSRFNPEESPSLPEHTLWLSCLIQAIYSAINKNNQEDLRWLKSKNLHPGSFLWICQACNINSTKLSTLIFSQQLKPQSSQPQKILQNFFWSGKKQKLIHPRNKRGSYKKALKDNRDLEGGFIVFSK